MKFKYWETDTNQKIFFSTKWWTDIQQSTEITWLKDSTDQCPFIAKHRGTWLVKSRRRSLQSTEVTWLVKRFHRSDNIHHKAKRWPGWWKESTDQTTFITLVKRFHWPVLLTHYTLLTLGVHYCFFLLHYIIITSSGELLNRSPTNCWQFCIKSAPLQWDARCCHHSWVQCHVSKRHLWINWKSFFFTLPRWLLYYLYWAL